MKDFQIPRDKIADYALVEPGKAKAFRSRLGFERKDADDLIVALSESASTAKLIHRATDEWGDRYYQDVVIQGRNGKSATVWLAWIRECGQDKLRLVSVYVKD